MLKNVFLIRINHKYVSYCINKIYSLYYTYEKMIFNTKRRIWRVISFFYFITCHSINEINSVGTLNIQRLWAESLLFM